MAPRPLRTDELDYHLPERLIATRPVEPRDSSRLLVMWRSRAMIEHRHVRDLPEYLRPGDALVFNNTRVIPARLVGRRTDTRGKVEGLYLHDETPKSPDGQIKPPSPNTNPQSPITSSVIWRVMLKAGGRLQPGHQVELIDARGGASGVIVELLERHDAEWVVRLKAHPPGATTPEILQAVGHTPLPPYILHARARASDDPGIRRDETSMPGDEQDRQWYQTIYAAADQAAGRGSVAAPTAGLHFTPELLRRIEVLGVQRIEITLHVGPGTFKPVTAETLDQHQMHSEWYEVSAAALDAIRRSKRPNVRTSRSPNQAPPTTNRQPPISSDVSPHGANHRLVAVGTTAVRTLESLPDELFVDEGGQICGPISGMTDLLIAPPYQFRLVDGMLTNFHLPRSTLLALVAAMVGLDRLMAVYQEAIERGYRFYSYGDAMLILP